MERLHPIGNRQHGTSIGKWNGSRLRGCGLGLWEEAMDRQNPIGNCRYWNDFQNRNDSDEKTFETTCGDRRPGGGVGTAEPDR